MTRRTLAAALALAAAAALLPGSRALASSGAALPVFDAHIHYSHDAWEVVPTAGVISLMREAGLRRALVSSSDDEGTQRLLAAAPDLVVPSLRPYRRRGEISTWVRDESVARHVEERLARFRYAAIGEFHLYGADADLPVPRRIVELAREHGLVLHAHSDADAVERIFRQDPGARVLWAHAGFDRPENVRALLARHRNLWADLAFRSEHGAGGKVDPAWREVFEAFPDRFMVGTDTFTPERLHYIPEHARWTRAWLADLPEPLAERIAWRNAEALLLPVWEASKARGATGAADPCAQAPAGSERVESAHTAVVWQTEPAAIVVGRPFAIVAAVCPKGSASGAQVQSLVVDATMPEHRHGMNYTPQPSRLPDGRWRADGLVFHMPGRWALTFDVQADGRRERLSRVLMVR
ncbi:MAG TPA: hypothetical protein VN324_13475 [Quisquiliibacterium sp.]|nr:hypothetical protein [Quisquiliibacterium sp.]